MSKTSLKSGSSVATLTLRTELDYSEGGQRPAPVVLGTLKATGLDDISINDGRVLGRIARMMGVKRVKFTGASGDCVIANIGALGMDGLVRTSLSDAEASFVFDVAAAFQAKPPMFRLLPGRK